MRLIDADELIKYIDYSADMGGALGKVVECVKYYAKYMVASAPTIEPEQRWIPCSERLPEVGEDVLFSVGGVYVAEGCLREDGGWVQFRWNATQLKDVVGAWRRLPDPWEGEQP